MRKKILSFLAVVAILLVVWKSETIAVISEGLDIKIFEMNSTGPSLVSEEQKNTIVQELHDNYGYEAEELILGDTGEDTLKLKTSVKILEKVSYQSGGYRYKIQIGNKIIIGTDVGTDYVTENDLINKYGFCGEETDKVTGFSWDVVLIGEIKMVNKQSNQYVAEGHANKLYSGDDYETGEAYQVKETGYELHGVSLLDEALAKLFIMLIEFVRGLYGDAPQMLLDSIQTTQYGTGISKFLPWKITYEKDEYTKDSYKNDYIKFSTDGSNVESNAKIVKEVSASENQFDEDTEIPVIPVDVYTLSIGQVSALDINFLTGQNNTELHSPDSVWTKLRNLAAGVIHITIYIGAGFLIATLIWHGICLVRSTLTPEDEKKHKDGIHDFAVAVAMLVGSIIIMAVCIFASKIVFEDMEVSSTKELPIRIVLTDNGSNIYSFSTNVTGYARYMSETQNTSLITQKLKYTIVYIICVWLNIISVIIMLIRMVAIIILSILGPIIAVAYAMKKQGVFNITYKTWIIHYALWSSIQLIFAIAYRIILEVAF